MDLWSCPSCSWFPLNDSWFSVVTGSPFSAPPPTWIHQLSSTGDTMVAPWPHRTTVASTWRKPCCTTAACWRGTCREWKWGRGGGVGGGLMYWLSRWRKSSGIPCIFHLGLLWRPAWINPYFNDIIMSMETINVIRKCSITSRYILDDSCSHNNINN